MGKIITVINEKGGIGKTSCAFNIAWELSRKKKVLILDMDGQRANITFFANIEKRDDTLTIFHALMTGADINDAIEPVAGRKSLFIVPATSPVSSLTETAKISRMRKVVDQIRDAYDYIIVDVNPTPNWSHVMALSCSDYALIPMLPDIASMEANNGIIETVEEIRGTTNPGLKVLGLVFNKYSSRTNLSKQVYQVAEATAQQLNTKVMKSTIRNAVALSECVYAHVGITDYAPSSPAAEDVRNLVKEIEREVRKNG